MASRKKLGSLKRANELTEHEWLLELEHIDNQLTHVLDVFNFLEELFRLSSESETALDTFTRTPLFWNVFQDCLQESMFMGLGRLCDTSKDVINVRRVLTCAMSHPEFFSTEALRQRLTERGLSSSSADHLLVNSWEPSNGNDLRFLEIAVRNHINRIEKFYAPIRDCYYGHRLIESDAHAMFERTNRAELGETLDMLRQLVAGLRFFYDNGAKPKVDVSDRKALDLTSRRSFRHVVMAVAGREL